MTNADATVNTTAGRKMGLKREITKAIDLNRSKPFPYIFVDRTPAARISGLCVFIDIFKKKVKTILFKVLSQGPLLGFSPRIPGADDS